MKSALLDVVKKGTFHKIKVRLMADLIFLSFIFLFALDKRHSTHTDGEADNTAYRYRTVVEDTSDNGRNGGLC